MVTTRTHARKAFGVLLSLLGILALGVVVTPTAQASRGGPLVPSLDWRPCVEASDKLCATARVPLDYDKPRGRTIELALAKLPAGDPGRRIGTVFINPGGPGASGVDMALSGFGDFLAENLDGRFDVVGFDPRGVAGSDPLHCFDSEEDRNAFFASQPVFPYRKAQERPFFNHYRSLGPECLDDRQAVARQMSTADVARDLDLLRRAVGDSRLTYYGLSYGSHIGNTYANLFPGRIRALAIDGVFDPRLYSSGWLIKIDRTGPQVVFDEALRLCDAAGPSCAFSAPGGSQARWQALADRIRREPLVIDPEFTYTYDLLIADAAGAMYAPEIWPDYMTFLDQVADAVLGDQRPVAAVAAARNRVLKQLEVPGPEADYPNGLDAVYGVQCADAEFPSRFDTYRAIGRYAERGSRIGPRWWWFYAGCADWPTAPDRYVGPWTARTSAPVLVVGNYYEAGTDYTGAQASARLLPNSRLLSYAGWGHTAYGRSDCITAHVDRYLLTGAPPPEGTVCPANPNPFTTVADRRAAPRVLVGLPLSKPGNR
jgi:pimeloyl-ACP methyl ester carboxylesterase